MKIPANTVPLDELDDATRQAVEARIDRDLHNFIVREPSTIDRIAYEISLLIRDAVRDCFIGLGLDERRDPTYGAYTRRTAQRLVMQTVHERFYGFGGEAFRYYLDAFAHRYQEAKGERHAR